MTETHHGWSLAASYLKLPDSMFTRIRPTPVGRPKLVVLNDDLAAELNLDEAHLRSAAGVAILAGNSLPPEAEPFAQAYAGHQFGHFTMLGDGRAVVLGERITRQGTICDIQLKGAGRTPYSRGGDGRAALGPMLREYIVSEGMHALGIPTSRSLAVVLTGETVRRDELLQGAVLTRVASSHIRVGTFQYAARFGRRDELSRLLSYTIARHFPELQQEDNPALSLLREVISRQARLVALWQLVGFVHGVMNTDNMTISGESIDYGPCAFLDVYHPETVFSSIDHYGRYAYGNQPRIAAWNLARLAETLLPLIDEAPERALTLANDELTRFSAQYEAHWQEGMNRKLGLMEVREEDHSLREDLLAMMQAESADYTHTFMSLAQGAAGQGVFASPGFPQWHERWRTRQQQEGMSAEDAASLMRRHNPAVIPRNHLVEEVLTAAEAGDYMPLSHLLEAVREPCAYRAEHMGYAALPPESFRRYRTFCGT